MKKVTMLFTLVALMLAGMPALAQTVVTLDQVNALPDGSLQQLNDGGANLTNDEVNMLIMSSFTGQEIQFTAVIISDPLNSGLASFDDARGGPGRIHVFVRDTAAATEGPEGMGMQVVDGNYETTGLINAVIGDVIRFTGTVSYFGSGVQFSPTTVEVIGDLASEGLPATILDPIVLSGTDALNMNVGDMVNQVNWDNFSDLVNSYVRIEAATILRRTIADAGRPNWNFSTDGGTTFSQNDDLSLRYRNDRIGSYQPPFNVRTSDNPFQPPAPGSTVDVQGFALFRGAFEAFDFVGNPAGAFMQIAPFSDDDLEVTTAPTITLVEVDAPDFVPGADDVPVTVTVSAANQADVASVAVAFSTSAGDVGSIALTDQGDGTYTGEIPAFTDGTFVTYTAIAMDINGATFESASSPTIRFLTDGINELSDIQETADGGFGDSPFRNVTTALDLTLTIQSQPSVSGLISAQDDPDLGPFSGIFLSGSGLEALNRGDVINITQATIEENFDVTQLTDITFTTVSTGGDFLGYKSLSTGALQNEAIAEAHEGLLVTFSDVEITTADAGFGEFAFASVNTDGSLQDPVRADDLSDDVASDFNASLTEGQSFATIQGIWYFSFGDYKLLPESMSEDIDTDIEEEAVPGGFVVKQNFPNPFNTTTEIRYEIGATTQVTLEVFDVLGRQVATLVDGPQPAGSHTATFDATNLPSGLYLYRITAGATQQTRTMTLLK